MNLSQINALVTTSMHNIELAWRLIFDYRIPLITKILAIGALVIYVVSPIDFVPDLLPVVGQIDDIVIFMVIMLQFINACPVEVIQEHKQAILNGEWKIGFLKYFVRGGN